MLFRALVDETRQGLRIEAGGPPVHLGVRDPIQTGVAEEQQYWLTSGRGAVRRNSTRLGVHASLSVGKENLFGHSLTPDRRRHSQGGPDTSPAFGPAIATAKDHENTQNKAPPALPREVQHAGLERTKNADLLHSTRIFLSHVR